jgi:hypothetical protein
VPTRSNSSIPPAPNMEQTYSRPPTFRSRKPLSTTRNSTFQGVRRVTGGSLDAQPVRALRHGFRLRRSRARTRGHQRFRDAHSVRSSTTVGSSTAGAHQWFRDAHSVRSSTTENPLASFALNHREAGANGFETLTAFAPQPPLAAQPAGVTSGFETLTLFAAQPPQGCVTTSRLLNHPTSQVAAPTCIVRYDFVTFLGSR